jgi:hypothetical protein
MMQWEYSEYPVIADGSPRLTNGSVEIKMTKSPRFATVKMGPNAEANTLPRPMDYAKWVIASDVPDDLKRFIRGKYWHKIDTRLVADALRSKGMENPANSYAEMSR